jgi:hypothetical protein
MFNTFVSNRTQHSSPGNITINEHRAPTAESVKMLKELEDAAENKLISYGRLENNIVSARWYVFNDYLNYEQHIIIRIKLNGTDIEVKTEQDIDNTPDEVAQHIYKSISAEISKLITINVMNNLIKAQSDGKFGC